MRRALFAVTLLALGGCGRCGRPGRADAGAPVARVTSDAGAPAVDAGAARALTPEDLLPAALADAPPFGGDPKRAVCGKAPAHPCAILQDKAAGKDALGRELRVVTARTSEPYDADFDQGKLAPREHWLLTMDRGAIVARAFLAAEVQRTAEPVDRTLTVKPNEVTSAPADVAPSSWNGAPTRTLSLSPLQLVAASDAQYNSNPAMIGGQDARLDLRDGSGEGSFHCETRDGAFLPIPSLRAIGGFGPEGGLGACAGVVDGARKHGFMKAGMADRVSGWFAASRLDGTLYVEVHDDRFTTGDRLEVRLGRPTGGMACMLDATPARVFAVDLGAPITSAPPLTARRVRDEPGVRTFAIDVGKGKNDLDPALGFALDFIDVDPGASRTISTTTAGPELGAILDLDDVGCGRTAAGPVALPLPPKPSK